jgi:hypothetical protein
LTATSFSVSPAAGTDPILFVDHQPAGRSGHLGHALFQNAKGEVFAFYPDCTGDDLGGHSAVGWMEYKVSGDGGESWAASRPLELSKRVFEAGEGRSVFSEKAVVTDSGAVVLFHLVCDISTDPVWQPYWVPLATRSGDGGHTWSAPQEVGEERGRIYDARFIDGVIYALKFSNDATVDYCGALPEHRYKLFVSVDDGLSFVERSILPFDTMGRCYGTLGVLPDGALIAYVYNAKDEFAEDYCISSDGGVTWSPPGVTRVSRRLRNPQMAELDGHYFLHGRSGSHGTEDEKGHFILYHSLDGLNWDDGTYLVRRTHGYGAYSNNTIVVDPVTGRRRLRIHASHAYANNQTNIVAWWVDSE